MVSWIQDIELVRVGRCPAEGDLKSLMEIVKCRIGWARQDPDHVWIDNLSREQMELQEIVWSKACPLVIWPIGALTVLGAVRRHFAPGASLERILPVC